MLAARLSRRLLATTLRPTSHPFLPPTPCLAMAGAVQNTKKRPFNEGRRHFKGNKKQKKETTVKEGSNEEVLIADVRALLEKHSISWHASNRTEETAVERKEESEKEDTPLPEPFTEIDLTIEHLSSTGDGLALIPASSQVAVVPFTAPGDKVTVKVIKHLQNSHYTLTDFVKVVQPSQIRDDSLVKCQYFSKCSGCQFQMMPYEHQLAHKKTIVEKAYKNFCDLPPSAIPAVGDTIGSPLQYGYRTKLTPHFDGPPGGRRDRRHGVKAVFPEVPPIGFMLKGTRKTMDIEDCPIGTDAVRNGMRSERLRVKEELDKYQRGATLLLRESTERRPKPAQQDSTSEANTQPSDTAAIQHVDEDRGAHIHRKICVTDPNAVSTEYVDDFRFDNPAGSFFQNNNSILPVFTKYIRDNILPPPEPSTSTSTSDDNSPPINKITNLIDAYCGSGLFTVALSPIFKNSIGIDVSASSIKFASTNATLNSIPPSSAHFLAGDANNIFSSITFPADLTAVVIDPSRKGCDENFLGQLLDYAPERVCYVSCNVHTQARDVGVLVGGLKGEDGQVRKEGLYEIESLRGFDFFPQTGHVEGVAFLRKKKGVVG